MCPNTSDLQLYIGYWHDVPVVTGSLFQTDVVGIYDLITRPDMQNKGFGSTMFYHLLHEAKKQDHQECILQASPDGLNIYQKAGFKTICELEVWSFSNNKNPA